MSGSRLPVASYSARVRTSRALAVVGRHGAEVAVEQVRDAARDLGQQRLQVDLAGHRDRGLDDGVELALAGAPGGELRAAADRPGQLLDVVDRDAPVAAGGAGAGQKAGRRPAADGHRRDAEAPRGVLHAQESRSHASTYGASCSLVNNEQVPGHALVNKFEQGLGLSVRSRLLGECRQRRRATLPGASKFGSTCATSSGQGSAGGRRRAFHEIGPGGAPWVCGSCNWVSGRSARSRHAPWRPTPT